MASEAKLKVDPEACTKAYDRYIKALGEAHLQVGRGMKWDEVKAIDIYTPCGRPRPVATKAR